MLHAACLIHCLRPEPGRIFFSGHGCNCLPVLTKCSGIADNFAQIRLERIVDFLFLINRCVIVFAAVNASNGVDIRLMSNGCSHGAVCVFRICRGVKSMTVNNAVEFLNLSQIRQGYFPSGFFSFFVNFVFDALCRFSDKFDLICVSTASKCCANGNGRDFFCQQKRSQHVFSHFFSFEQILRRVDV